jgi:hypothetical protein
MTIAAGRKRQAFSGAPRVARSGRKKFTAETQRRGENFKKGCPDGASSWSSPGFESAEVAEAAERGLGKKGARDVSHRL